MTVKEQDYISVNRSAYDALAEEYRSRATVDRVKDVPLIAPFVAYLRAKFGSGCHVIDIGPGNGVNLKMLSEAGFSVTGVDISREMLKVSAENCPEAKLYLGDFLAISFEGASFHGVFAKASLHCYPRVNALRAFRKIHAMLVPGGMFYVTTTAQLDSTEGYSSKDDYPGQLVRFRKHWTPSELTEAVVTSEFALYKEGFDFEADWNKRWYNIWALKV